MSASAGVRVLVRAGDRVSAGQPLLEVHADDEPRLVSGVDRAAGAVVLVGYDDLSVPEPVPLVLEVVRA